MAEKRVDLTVKELLNLEEKGLLSLILEIQRQRVWDNTTESTFIDSILDEDIPIPEFFLVRLADNTFIVIDGLQRTTTLLKFIRNEFALGSNTPDINGLSVKGLRFAELPIELQGKILNRSLYVRELWNISAEKIAEIFCRLNNGEPLKNIEKLRAMLGETNLKFVKEMASTEFIKNKVKMTTNMRRRYIDQELCLQIIMINSDDSTGLSGKDMKKYVNIAKNYEDFSNKTKTEIRGILGYLNEAFLESQRYLRKLHIPIIFVLAKDAIAKGIAPQDFGVFITDFFSNLTKTNPYYISSQSGSATQQRVKTRLDEMRKAYRKAFPVKLSAK